MSETVHAPSSLQAAERICTKLCEGIAERFDKLTVLSFAAIIEEETALPELLEACKVALECIERTQPAKGGFRERIANQARAAIAKATK